MHLRKDERCRCESRVPVQQRSRHARYQATAFGLMYRQREATVAMRTRHANATRQSASRLDAGSIGNKRDPRKRATANKRATPRKNTRLFAAKNGEARSGKNAIAVRTTSAESIQVDQRSMAGSRCSVMKRGKCSKERRVSRSGRL